MPAVAASHGATVGPAGPVSGRATKLFIGGLTRNTTTKLLREHFGQYGRILDCIAMVQPDGKPRGFGYVTLDTPAAADRVLAQMQVVDGRVVDVKRAVRNNQAKQSAGVSDGRAMLAGRSPVFPPGAWAGAYQEAAWPLTWPELGAGADCLDLLRGVPGAFPCDAWDAGLADENLSAWSGFGVAEPLVRTSDLTKTADAPVFIPSPAAGEEAPKKVALPMPVGGCSRGVLGDITNFSGGKLSSPMRLPTSDKLTAMSSPCKLPVPAAVGAGNRARKELKAHASNLGVYIDDSNRSDDARENVGHSENVPTPAGLALPPGLEHLAEKELQSGMRSPTSSLLSTIPTFKAAAR